MKSSSSVVELVMLLCSQVGATTSHGRHMAVHKEALRPCLTAFCFIKFLWQKSFECYVKIINLYLKMITYI